MYEKYCYFSSGEIIKSSQLKLQDDDRNVILWFPVYDLFEKVLCKVILIVGRAVKNDLSSNFTGNQVPQPVSGEDCDITRFEFVFPSLGTSGDIWRRFVTIEKGFVLVNEWDYSRPFNRRKGLDILAVLSIAQRSFREFVITVSEPLEMDRYGGHSCERHLK